MRPHISLVFALFCLLSFALAAKSDKPPRPKPNVKWGYHLDRKPIPEFFALAGIAAYFGVFVWGKRRNQRMALSWATCVFDQLRDNFASVTGDKFPLVPISYSEWRAACSGRRNIQSMNISVDLVKRQDVVSSLLEFLSPSHDRITFEATFDSDVQRFVALVARKSEEKKIRKEFPDINMFAHSFPAGPLANLLPGGVALYCEHQDLIDPIVQRLGLNRLLKQFPKQFLSLYISDRTRDAATIAAASDSSSSSSAEGEAAPEPVGAPRALTVRLVMRMPPIPDASLDVLPGVLSGEVEPRSPAEAAFVEALRAQQALMREFLAMIDTIAEIKHSRDTCAQVTRNRAIAAEAAFKAQQQQRQEEAQKRKEERLRREQEEIMKLPPEEQRRREARMEKARARKQSGGQRMKVVMG